MINIAICDDVEIERDVIRKEVCKYFVQKDKLYKISLFDGSKKLWYEIEEGKQFDILLLDIDMPEISGIDLTYKIKKKMPEALVIFVTSYDKYVYDVFKVQPYRFIPKDRLEEMLSEALDDALSYINEQSGKVYIVENQQGVEKVYINKIIYIWHSGKYAYIEKKDGQSIKIRKTLKEVYNEIADEHFIWISRGCICNLKNVDKIVGQFVLFPNGDLQQISKERLKEVKEKLLKYEVE